MRIFKSALAVILGLTAGIGLSVLTDMALLALGFDIRQLNNVPFSLVLFILGYRFACNVLSCWLAARFAPNQPMRHALTLGLLGLLISSAGALLMWNEAPAYYHIGLIVLALPAAWLGGRLYSGKK